MSKVGRGEERREGLRANRVSIKDFIISNLFVFIYKDGSLEQGTLSTT